MAQPRFGSEGNKVFSRKMGVFPSVTFQPAQRRNIDVGTLEMEPITSVTREISKGILIYKVIPEPEKSSIYINIYIYSTRERKDTC